MSNEEIKPCPFCGGKAEVWQYLEDDFSVKCDACNAELGFQETKTEAIKAWNRRVGGAA